MSTAEDGTPRDCSPSGAGEPCGHGQQHGGRLPTAVLPCALLAALLASAPSVTACVAEELAAPPAARARIPPGAALPLLGRDVKGPSGQVVAQIVNVLVDEAGRPLAAVLDYGGFLGVGRRRIAVAWEALRFAPGQQDGTITLDLTREQLKDFPEHKKGEPVVAGAPAPAAAPQ
jgi:PRC-barrel domain